MSKSSSTAAETQLVANPQVSIVYSPEKQILALGNEALHVLGQLRAVKVTNARSLAVADIAIAVATQAQDEIATVRDALASRVKEAFEPYKKFPLFQGSEINITLSIPVRQQIETAFRTAKQSRANFLAAEDERVRRENLAKQAEQDRINEEAAKKAAKEAKGQGASKETVAEIKQAVMETPAPVVTSRALENATSSVRYTYGVKIINLKSFLGACLNNPILLNTLVAAVPDIEKAFRKMANPTFECPGVELVKKAVDVNR